MLDAFEAKKGIESSKPIQRAKTAIPRPNKKPIASWQEPETDGSAEDEMDELDALRGEDDFSELEMQRSNENILADKAAKKKALFGFGMSPINGASTNDIQKK